MRAIIFYSLLLIFVLTSFAASSQSLPVGTISLEDYFRRRQLEGRGDSSVSFTIRPFHSSSPILKSDGSDSLLVKRSARSSEVISNWQPRDPAMKLFVLPADLQVRLNSHHPYGWNDGPMIPARGLQTVLSAGIYAEYGHLSLQLKPEFVIAENQSFRGFPQDYGEILWYTLYYDYYNNTDLPERFGKDSYSKLFWGQSSVRLNFDPVSFGLSSENLWWGPGFRSSLLMSNTAPGFKHLSFNTSRPVQTAIGSFEAQLIAGRLEGSGFSPMEPNPDYFGEALYLPKSDDWRYLSGLSFTWRPKWVPGLFLGFSSTSQVYSKDLEPRDYFPGVIAFRRTTADDPINVPDTRSSVFFRWIWPEEKAEIYFEYGLEDPVFNLRNIARASDNSRAFIFGLRKLIPFGTRADENLQISLEATQLQQNSANAIRAGKSWYVDQFIRHGYTNRGEALGAGIGPGANLQTLDLSWVKGLKRLGIQLERYVHNNDYYYYAFESKQDWRRHWTDLSIAAGGEWDYKKFLFNARIQAIQSYNYKWYLKDDGKGTIPYPEVNGIDAFNLHLQLGTTYRF